MGLAAIQIARMVGARPIATTRTHAKKAALLDAGAAHVIVTQEEESDPEVMRITPGRAPLGVRSGRGSFVETLAAATASGGVIFLYGALSMQPTPFPLFRAGKGLVLRGYTLFEIVRDPERLARGKAFIRGGSRMAR